MGTPFDFDRYDERVKLGREKRSRVLEVIRPLIEEITNGIATSSQGIFDRTPIKVGSYYQGLKTDRTDEFDLNIPIKKIGNFVWCYDNSPGFITYGFQDALDDDQAKTTSRQNLRIVERGQEQRHYPETGYLTLKLFGDTAEYFKSMGLMYNCDLVPYLVRQQFKNLLSEQCQGKSSLL